MSLESRVGASLERVTPSAQTVRRLLAGAARHIVDAKSHTVSAETRFVSAYTAVRMLADAGLNASGYRTLSSRPGHHHIAIQSLADTFGIEESVIARLDALRKQRNLAEYSGDTIPAAILAECVRQAEALQARAAEWFKAHKPELT